MRRLFWYLLIAPISTLGVLAGGVLVHSYPALTPVLELTGGNRAYNIEAADSIAELREIRDRLIEQSQQKSSSATEGVPITNPALLLQILQATEIRIQIEETAQENWSTAVRNAEKASQLGTSTELEEAEAGEIYQLWSDAVRALREIPEDSFLGAQAAAKLDEYKDKLGVAAYRYDSARSGFLDAIAESTGRASDVHVTVCNLQRECRRLRGNEPPASPASLIKVPVAIALTQKLEEENIDIDTPMLVSPRNFTEDAAKIWVGAEYPTRKVLLQMITHSSNIATNQLIDYMGTDYINQVLRDRGYRTTRVNTKLIGDNIAPAGLSGIPNQITTDELTDMMVGIYNNEHPGDDVILEGLVNQYDWDLAYEAIKRPAVWIGEKTGQNSKVLGTTAGVNIKGDRYVITVAINYTASEPAVKKVVKGIVDHLLANDGF
ncbi:serine hydrolase [Leptolyngbya sp. AN02str]|uniref:serine hydrolase n=1 Tax=Leptolyngbya sp. AN02str TaxID=3423363 RepID=UPI003D3185D2